MIAILSLLLAAIVASSNGCLDVRNDRPDVLVISPVLHNGLYPKNLNCSYSITQFMPHGLTFEFLMIDLELDDFWRPCKADAITCKNQCKNDFIAILDGTGTEATRRCGKTIPGQKYSLPPGPGLLWFKTDGRTEGVGFTLRVSVDPDSVPCRSTSYVSGMAGSVTNYVRFMDRNYRANEDCKWVINVPSNFDTIKITVTRVAIQGFCDGNVALCSCPNDFVAVYDGENERAPILTQRCGFTAPYQPVFYTTRSSRPTAFVWFKSDATEEYPGWELTYEGCNAPCEKTTPETTTHASGNFQWPNGNSLVAFWPLDGKNQLNDVSQRKLKCTKNCQGVLDGEGNAGPFGDPTTSYHTRAAGEPILAADSLIASTPKQSFTVAFFIRIPMSDVGGVLSFVNDQGAQTFAIDVLPGRPQLRIRGGASTTTDAFGPYDVIWPNAWTFLAVVFNGDYCTLGIYGKYGELYMPSFKESLCNTKGQIKNLRLGVTTADGQLSTLSSSSSISCVSVYSTALKIGDISQIHEACRVAHQTAPCGAPRIPLRAIPPHPFGLPTYGHFPYIASIKRTLPMSPTSHVCAASIIDAFHLLTAATCFTESKEPFHYSVIVGEHTLLKEDSFERRHAVSKLFVRDPFNITYGNIAVIELSTPIDFSNYYVNSICLPETSDVTKPDTTALFFGWGSNGRPAESNTALPRYVSGSKVACGADWQSQYIEGFDICFKSSSDPKTPCGKEDQGSPLLIPADTIDAKQSRLVPIGVYGARLGNDCSNPAPALFTDVISYNVKSKIACNIPGFTYPDICPIGYS